MKKLKRFKMITVIHLHMTINIIFLYVILLSHIPYIYYIIGINYHKDIPYIFLQRKIL